MQRSPNLLKSFSYAIEGIRLAYKYNRNLRIHTIIALCVILFGFLLQINPFETGIVCVMILLVISTEMINTVIEEMVNLITNEHRQEAKIAKDVAAGMVLLTSLGSIVVGLFVFVPHILRLLR